MARRASSRASSRAPLTRPRRPSIRIDCLLCCLILAFLVIFAAFNIARVLTLPEFTVRAPQREVVVKSPTYYDILGVTPLVDDEDLARMRKKFVLEAHPDKLGNTEESVDNFIEKTKIFDTLQNGRLRCEYDKEHRIKGKWPFQTCRDAFREEYRKIMRSTWERFKETFPEEQKEAWEKQGGPKPRDSNRGEPGRPKIKVEVKVEPEPEPEIFEVVKGAGTRVKDGLVYWLFVAKDAVVECSESVSSFLGSFWSIFGTVRV